MYTTQHQQNYLKNQKIHGSGVNLVEQDCKAHYFQCISLIQLKAGPVP